MGKRLIGSIASAMFLVAAAFAVRYPIANISGPNPGQVTAMTANGGILALSFDSENLAANQVNLYKTGTWEQLATLTIASDPNAYVLSISITPDYIVAGAYNWTSQVGSVYIFQLPASGQWQNENETAVLSPSDPQTPNYFGNAVAAWGGTVIVGDSLAGPSYDPPGKGYVFLEPSGGWVDATENAQLTASQPGYPCLGGAVGMMGNVGENGNEIVMSAFACASEGSSGAIYVYDEPAGGWENMTETAVLTDATSHDGPLGAYLGFGKDTIVATEQGSNSDGSVLVYEKSGNWQTTSQPSVRITHPQAYWESVAIRQDGSRLVACCGTDSPNKGRDLLFLYRKNAGFQQPTELSTHGLFYYDTVAAITEGYAFGADGFVVGQPAEVYIFDGE
jgi:hypothetical protein